MYITILKGKKVCIVKKYQTKETQKTLEDYWSKMCYICIWCGTFALIMQRCVPFSSLLILSSWHFGITTQNLFKHQTNRKYLKTQIYKQVWHTQRWVILKRCFGEGNRDENEIMGSKNNHWETCIDYGQFRISSEVNNKNWTKWFRLEKPFQESIYG